MKIKIFERAIIFVINIYQKLISPILGSNCRFIPTCSQYTKECFKNYGIVKAFLLSGKRILACHPFSKGGYYPVLKDKDKQ